jgi:MATE family multidrug resistance protein
LIPALPLGTRDASWGEEMRDLVRLAAPIVVTQLGQMAIGTTDVVMLGAFDNDALAAAALGLSLYFGVMFFGMSPGLAVAPMIAHVRGKHPGRWLPVRGCVRMALWAVMIMVPALVLFLYFATDMLLALGEPPALAEQAGGFVRRLCLGLPFALAYNVLRGFVTALFRPAAALIVMGLAILFNGLADYALIFGHFGAPRLGLMGAAFASAGSFIFSFLGLWGAICATPALHRYRVFRRLRQPDWSRLAEIFRLGLPMGATIVLEIMFFSSGMLIQGHFGSVTVSAHQIALNVASLTFMVPQGIGTAVTVRIGVAAAAGDLPAVRRSGLAAIALSASFMALCGIVMAAVPDRIAGLYVDRGLPGNHEVVERAVLFLRCAAAFQLLDAVQVTASLALRGMKDAALPMALAAGSYWLVGFPAALWLSFGTGLEGVGVWLAFILALLVAAVSLSLRFALKSGMIGRPPNPAAVRSGE